MGMEITSAHNPRVKHLLSLQKPRERRAQGLFTAEGGREVSLALGAGYKAHSIFLCPSLFAEDEAYPVPLESLSVTSLPEALFDKVAYRGGTGGIIAVLEARQHPISALGNTTSGLFLIIEGVEKPGNIGAMLRTADAADVDGVILTDAATDLYNPNVIRSSVGCVFTVPIAVASQEETAGWLGRNGIRSFAADLRASQPYHQQDLTGGVAVLMGSEADGLSDFWAHRADVRVIIPMRGRIDSMNVSNAAAVLLFEALRQRS